MILNLGRIKYDNVGKEAWFQFAAFVDSQRLRWQGRQLAYRLLKCQHIFITDIFAEHARKAAISARVWVAFQENALWRQ